MNTSLFAANIHFINNLKVLDRFPLCLANGEKSYMFGLLLLKICAIDNIQAYPQRMKNCYCVLQNEALPYMNQPAAK